MTAAPPIKLACMNLMWGCNVPTERMVAWLGDSAAAGYEGVATFDRDLIRFTAEGDFRQRLADLNLQLERDRRRGGGGEGATQGHA